MKKQIPSNNVFHQAWVKVEEKGTEAAVATAITSAPVSKRAIVATPI